MCSINDCSIPAMRNNISMQSYCIWCNNSWNGSKETVHLHCNRISHISSFIYIFFSRFVLTSSQRLNMMIDIDRGWKRFRIIVVNCQYVFNLCIYYFDVTCVVHIVQSIFLYLLCMRSQRNGFTMFCIFIFYFLHIFLSLHLKYQYYKCLTTY